MARIALDCTKKSGALSSWIEIERRLNDLSYQVDEVKSGLRYKVSASRQISTQLKVVSEQIKKESASVRNLNDGLTQILSAYEHTESANSTNLINNGLSLTATADAGLEGENEKEKSIWNEFLDTFFKEFGISTLLAGSNYVGKIYDLFNELQSMKNAGDLFKTGKDMVDFLKDAAKTWSNYKQIGNAVGTKTAFTWWAKNAVGLKPLGRASSAKNIFTRFKNNLTNKTSPFNAQIKERLGNFAGKNGTGKAIASWASVIATGVVNWFDNKAEQENSNGTMSDGRVIAETVMETTIDTVASIGASALVGAAVTTVLGTVAAPAVVVTAISGLALAGINAGVKALTGKTATEWVSDAILDTGEAIGKAIGSAAKNVKDTVCGWFKKLSFA